MRKTNKILLTAGDPHGIGTETILRALKPEHYSKFLIIGNDKVFLFYKECLNIKIPINIIDTIDDIDSRFNSLSLNVLNLPYNHTIIPGKLTKHAGELALRCIDTAIGLIKKGFSNTIITAPVNKKAISKTNPLFIGHTEYLAGAFNTKNITMLLSSDKLKVALVTTHLPLSKVSKSINHLKVLNTIKNCDQFLKQIKSKRRIAVCSLNPHAGEGGHFGDEESSIIVPAIEKAKELAIDVSGPYSSDTIFCKVYDDEYDLFIAIYHDQGLIPYKLLSFGEGVNITLGLPFSRVSVDHGTAFDIAGKGEADYRSMEKAIEWAFMLRPSK